MCCVNLKDINMEELEQLFEESDMERKSKDDSHHGRITINVGGQRHEAYLTTLKNHPDTRLYWITEQHHTSTKSPEYNAEKKEYFFDRHPGVFAHIVNYYRTGKLHCPMDVCGPLFEEELSFWGIDEGQVELCCWESYKQHKDKQEKLKYFTPPTDNNDQEDEPMDSSWWKILRKKGHTLLEKPSSSTPAKIISILNFVVFLITTVQFCLITLKSFKQDSHRTRILSNVRLFSVTWFLLDFVLRLLFMPSLVEYFKKALHWLDVVSVCTLIVHVKIHHHSGDTEISPFEMLMFLKAVRLFNLLTFSFVIQVLTNALKASSRELCLLTIVVLFQAFVFSAIVFFIERGDSETEFESVPRSLWWAIITMTTVGYGDIQPKTWVGQILGCCCALCGVLVIALPVSVVATNFSLFYTYAKARLNLPPKEQQKQPLSKELTSLKAKKAELAHTATNQSYTSIPRKSELSAKGSTERLSPENDEKCVESGSRKSSSSERRRTDATLPDMQLYEKSEFPLTNYNTPMTPSFEECDFDFLEVPSNKRLKKSFLSNSISRVFGVISHPARGNHQAPKDTDRDVHSTYRLYCRRGAVAPGSASSRSLSSSIYDSGPSNLPNCVKRSMNALRRKRHLSRSGKVNARKCTSNAELHLICFHRCNRHPEEVKETNSERQTTISADCLCPSHSSAYSKPRHSKSCSELNDILQGNFRNSLYSSGNSDALVTSSDMNFKDGRAQSFPKSEIAITINNCSEDEMSLTNNNNTGINNTTPLLQVHSPRTKRRYLNPLDPCSELSSVPMRHELK